MIDFNKNKFKLNKLKSFRKNNNNKQWEIIYNIKWMKTLKKNNKKKMKFYFKLIFGVKIQMIFIIMKNNKEIREINYLKKF